MRRGRGEKIKENQAMQDEAMRVPTDSSLGGDGDSIVHCMISRREISMGKVERGNEIRQGSGQA